jgi:hypothetical protein
MGLKARLSASQTKTMGWVARKLAAYGAGRGLFIAHEMGNGKTLLAIACALRAYFESGRASIVVCPLGAIEEWCQEARRHLAPEWAARVLAVHASFDIQPGAGEHFLIVTSYESVHSKRALVCDTISKYEPYNLLFFDEGHLLRNAETRRRASCLTLCGKHRIALSGTPFQNGIGDIVSAMSLIGVPPFCEGSMPQTHQAFQQAAAKFPEAFFGALRCVFIRDAPGMSSPIKKRIHMVARPFARRERDAYIDMVDQMRSIPAHPFALRTRIMVTCGNAHSKIVSLHTYVKARAASAQPTCRFLVFANYRKMQRLALKALRAWGVVALAIDASMKSAARSEVLRQFRTTSTPPVEALVLSFGACSHALNLPEATNVVFMDLADPNPFNYLQAQSRVLRPGQLAPVVDIYFFVVSGTLEAHVPHIHKAKRELSAHLLAVIPNSGGGGGGGGVALARRHFICALDMIRQRTMSACRVSLFSPRDLVHIVDGIRSRDVYIHALIESYRKSQGSGAYLLDYDEFFEGTIGSDDGNKQTASAQITSPAAAAAAANESFQALAARFIKARMIDGIRESSAALGDVGLSQRFARLEEDGLFLWEAAAATADVTCAHILRPAKLLFVDIHVVERIIQPKGDGATGDMLCALLADLWRFVSHPAFSIRLAKHRRKAGIRHILESGSVIGFVLQRASSRFFAAPGPSDGAFIRGEDVCVYLPPATATATATTTATATAAYQIVPAA